MFKKVFSGFLGFVGAVAVTLATVGGLIIWGSDKIADEAKEFYDNNTAESLAESAAEFTKDFADKTTRFTTTYIEKLSENNNSISDQFGGSANAKESHSAGTEHTCDGIYGLQDPNQC